MTDVSIATWNLHHGVDKRSASMKATWRYLETELRPTVALIQEADGVPATTGGQVVERADEVRYETAVVGYAGRVEPITEAVTRHSKIPVDLAPRVPGTYAIAQVVGLKEVDPFVAVSVYGRIIGGYAQTSILRALADLIPLLDSPQYRDRIVLGGDLNAFDQPPADRTSQKRWAVLWQLFESLGLVNLLQQTQPKRGVLPGCRCGRTDCWHVETWRPVSKRHVPGVWCLDYLFATKQLADRLIDLEVVGAERPQVWNLSDHCPLVARFDL